MLRGGELDPYKSAPPTSCWWCGSTAPLTQEHKFKKTDLLRMLDEDGLMRGDGDAVHKIRSVAKSPGVRFRHSLCAKCNNERSQPFDYAYDAFSEYLWSNQAPLWRKRHLDLREVYSEDWKLHSLHLARYVAKHMACRMVNDGYEVPPGVVPFLEGAPVLNAVQMVLTKNRDLHRLYRLGGKEAVDLRGLWLGAAFGGVSRSRQRLTVYASSLSVGHVGVFYRWDEDYPATDPFYLYQRARLHLRHRLPANLAPVGA